MKNFIKFSLPFIVALGVFVYACTANIAHAATAGLSFSPGGGSYTTGQDFSVTIYGTGGGGFGYLSTNVAVTYPANLTVKSINKDGSALSDATLTHNAGSRTISFTHGTWGVLGAFDNAKLFTVVLQGTSPGSALLDFSATTLRGVNVAKNPATYNLSAPACPAGQTGTPPNCITPAPAPTPTTPAAPTPSTPTAAPKTTTPAASKPSTPAATPSSPTPVKAPDPTIADANVAVSYDSAEITWDTTNAATASLRYGLKADQLTETAEVTNDGSKFAAKLSGLQLGTEYIYEVVVKNSSEVSTTYTNSFTTKAYPVLIRITQGTAPLSAATVSLKDRGGVHTTSKKGEVELSLMPGKYSLQIKKDTLSDTQPFTVKQLKFPPGTTPEAQIIPIKLAAATPTAATSTDSQSTIPLFGIGIAIFAILACLGLAAFLWRRHRATQEAIGYESIIEQDYSPVPVSDTQTAATITPTEIAPYGVAESPYTVEASQMDPTTTYTPPSYIPPPYGSGGEIYANPADIPMAPADFSSNTEPADMWSQPTEANLQPSDEQALYDEVPSDTPSEASSSTTQYYNTSENLHETGWQQPIDSTPPQQVSEYAPPTQAQTPYDEQHIALETDDKDYEYNEDNSMTIHHAH